MGEAAFVDTQDGARLAAYAATTDARLPWLVFSNSVLTDASIWSAQVTALASRYRILRYDQRGHGASTSTDRAMSFDDYGSDLLAVLDAFDVANCAFVGLSMGVPTGLAAFSSQPERFTRFVAVDGIARSGEGRKAFWAELREFALAGEMDRLAVMMASRWLPEEPTDAPMSTALQSRIAATDPFGFAAATYALSGYDYSTACQTLAVPFLALAGAEDGAMPDTMRNQFSSVPQAQFETIANAGHLPNLQKPDAFNRALSAFLSTTEKGDN